MVVVPKKGGAMRHPERTLAQLSGAKVFSKFDTTSSFGNYLAKIPIQQILFQHDTLGYPKRVEQNPYRFS